MYIYPNLYKKFECIGSACKNSCCYAGWRIPLDPDTTDYYQHLNTDFGAYLRKNIYEEDDMTLIRLTSDGRCPFLDEDGLCQVYRNCGPEHMSIACQGFPRRRFTKGKNTICGLSLSCEAVLQLLQDDSEPIQICVEGATDLNNISDVSVYEIAQFIAWGTELLQDSSIPLGIALGTVLYMGMEVAPYFKNQDYPQIEHLILQSESIQKEFELVKESIGKDELENSAWQFILQVTDTFYATFQQISTPHAETLLWQREIATLSDSDRKEYIRNSYLEHRTRQNEEQHLLFMRRLASLLFCGHSLGIEIQESEQIFLHDICNFMLLAEILPATCAAGKTADPDRYHPGLVDLSRLFEQTHLIANYVCPIIKKLFSPDTLTYTLAFMVLFDEL